MKDSNKVIKVCEVKFYAVDLFNLNINTILNLS